MRYFEYITKFLGADHPFGDLASDISTECSNDDEMMDIYDSSFAEIYDHLTSIGASPAAVDTFIDSWSAYRKYEKEGFKNPVPFVVADQLREMNRNLREIGDELKRHNDFMENVSDSLYTDDGETVSEVFDRIAVLCSDCVEVRKDTRGKEYSLLRVCGTVDTYEQNS